ncbi:MAG: cyclodeaminase/cyclohydrolase family protein [Chloroflexota bacterium]
MSAGMDDPTLSSFLQELASGAPTPGGGGAAALMAATGAALVSMVCTLTVGRPRYAAVEQRLSAALAEAGQVRREAYELIAADAAAYGAVAEVFTLPRTTEDEKAIRQTRMQRALKGAADPPLRIAACAVTVLRLCADVADGGNTSVLSDITVATLAARAALDAAAVNVRINLHAIRDPAFVAGAEERLAALLDEGRGHAATALERTTRTTGVSLDSHV